MSPKPEIRRFHGQIILPHKTDPESRACYPQVWWHATNVGTSTSRGHKLQIITTVPIHRNNKLGLAGRGINLRMIKANNKPGGPDTRHFMSPDTNQCRGYTPYVDSKATINQCTPGSGTQNQNRPCPCVSWSEDHKVKAPTKKRTNNRPRKSTNTQAYNEWITTDTSHKHDKRRGGRRANQNNYGTATNTNYLPHPTKKQPMNFYITKGNHRS